MQDLGQLTTLQQRVVRFVVKDAAVPTPNQVPLVGDFSVTVDQPAAVGISNVHMDTDARPVGSAWFANFSGNAPTSGEATVTVGPMDTQFSISVVRDPSLPGPQDHFDAEPGPIVPK